MDTKKLTKINDYQWRIEATERMLVPAVIFADEKLILEMDDKVCEQISNVAALPGIVKAAYAMPDAHWGYGFPIGGVAAFDPNDGGVISAGGVGFDISCGVRTLYTGLKKEDIESNPKVKDLLADELFRAIPAGVGSSGEIKLSDREIDHMLRDGAKWAVDRGYGFGSDLPLIEENGQCMGAEPEFVSVRAKERQRKEMGTLGSGNHYCEIQIVSEILEPKIADALHLAMDDVLVSIHCGSRGLGHQIATDYLREMAIEASKQGIHLTDRELACAPIKSSIGKRYLGAMRAGINCALANRQILTHLIRQAFNRILPAAKISLLYDVSHNTCKAETYEIEGKKRQLFIHRKGATRAFGPKHPSLSSQFNITGQPVLIGGSMGTHSYILVGTTAGDALCFSSSCHGAGRRLSRHQAAKQWQGRELIDHLKSKGILIRSYSYRGVAEEAPGAYKDVTEVVEVAEKSGISKRVVKLDPIICIKG